MSSVLPPQQIPSPPPVPLARFSVDQYHRLIESGAFTENDPLELIDGWVVTKMPKGPAQEYATGQGEELLRDRIPPGWHVRNQAPITLSNGEPEPELSVVRGDRSDYRTRHPAADDEAFGGPRRPLPCTTINPVSLYSAWGPPQESVSTSHAGH